MLELAARFSETLYRGPLAHEKMPDVTWQYVHYIRHPMKKNAGCTGTAKNFTKTTLYRPPL